MKPGSCYGETLLPEYSIISMDVIYATVYVFLFVMIFAVVRAAY